LAVESPEYLKPGGHLAVEVGVGQSRVVGAMLSENGFRDVRFAEDLAGIERVVIGEML
jgi:release factor glutamine methyltransferase